MRRAYLVLWIILALAYSVRSQSIHEFSRDTGLFVSEVVSFIGSSLETSEVPDFERFIRLYDSLPYDSRMEIIDMSNLLLDRKGRPRPHFIAYQKIMNEFLIEDKVSHGYEEWREGFRILLLNEQSLLKVIGQWLSLSLSLLEDNTFYKSTAVRWKASEPSFQFQTDQAMTILFDRVTVSCYSGQDSIQILNTSGYLDPVSLEWKGNQGKVTWERAGMPEAEIYAFLHDFKINLKTPGYSADSVQLFYPSLFEGIAHGRLEDKVSQIKDLASVKYPQFTSYKSSYEIIDFIPGLDFRGGLSIEGANLLGSGVEGEPAELKIYSNDTLRIRAKAQRVSMNSRHIRAPHAAVSIFFGGDSIYHPDLVFSLDVSKDQLRLYKSEDYKSEGPFSNTYHKVDMNFEEILWNRKESFMNFQALQGTSVGRASFESNTFFDYDFYIGLQGMDYEHPLAQLYTYSNMLGGRTFAVPNYASYVGYSLYQVRHLLMSLSKLGFVYYDDEKDLVTLRQKLFDYIIASMKQRDYDVIRFNSRTEGASNARLDLQTRDLTISGIPVIFLSDSQNVRLFPKNNSITMKQDRSFQFDGTVDAGLFRFSGQDFFFDYDSFKIDLKIIDSLQLSIHTGEYNQYGEHILARIDNNIEDMTGELLIDDPLNKSGLEKYPQYPTFTSKENSYIYFDSKNIQNGVYHRDEFYFELEPFTIDSLDNFRPEAISPNGTFISAGILPPLQMQMTLRDDKSLGFYMETSEEGFPLYGGVGTFHNGIEMSNKGLVGYGSFDYLTSTTWSEAFLMHPDSLLAVSQRFLIREKVEDVSFPYVENERVYMTLRPGEDVMELEDLGSNFKIFNDSTFHGGNLALRPGGLSGDGVMALPDARLESDFFSYNHLSIYADSAGVQLKDKSRQEFAFLTEDVNIRIALDERRGQFRANGDATLIDLPYNLYETKLDDMVWYMDRDEVALSQSKRLEENTVDIGIDSLKSNGPLYLSRHPGQDSLSFNSPFALYNYKDRLLQAREVSFIEVADAYVFPSQGNVEIGQQATMSELKKAKLLANQENRQHLIFNASITVNGAMDYLGSGYYIYTDAFDNAYKIFFNRIWVDTTIQSQSKGEIMEDDVFMLSPYFDFRGEVTLAASSPTLLFDGGTRIVHDCNIRRDWLRFTSAIDPAHIQIPVPESMQNVALNKIFAGSMITRDSTHIYTAFLSGRTDYFDKNITDASGVLLYDPDQRRYIISGPEKIASPVLPGNYLSLEPATCQVYGEGPIDLTLEYGQVKITSAGNALHKVSDDEFSTNLSLGLDFYFSPEALQVMGREIDSLPDLEPVDLSSPRYQLAMRDLLGGELAGTLERQLGLTGTYGEIPSAWYHTLFFNEFPLKWNQETRSFRHNGKIGIGNIGNIQVNKKVHAYIEMVEKGSGDIFDMYLRVDDRTWYYIAFSPGGLQVLSSNREFNNIVFNLKAGERRVKGKVGQAQYVYSLAARRRLDLFIERFMEYERSEQGF
ncbi:MAG: hypothetical protein ABFS28_01000 [Bacteroidota bacterium]